VELDRAFRRLRLEIGRGVADGQSHLFSLLTILFEARTLEYKKDGVVKASRPCRTAQDPAPACVPTAVGTR
jgi:hypothetical protein